MSSIGSFSFDAMRGRLNPDAVSVNESARIVQRGTEEPSAGIIETEILCDDLATAVSTAAFYRASIGDIVAANINGDSIARVLILDCLTRVYGGVPKISLLASWSLVAGIEWEP